MSLANDLSSRCQALIPNPTAHWVCMSRRHLEQRSPLGWPVNASRSHEYRDFPEGLSCGAGRANEKIVHAPLAICGSMLPDKGAPMPRMLKFVPADVFTDRPFGRQSARRVPDARAVSTEEQMQAIAREFNLSETTFVLPPAEPASPGTVRIFTPGRSCRSPAIRRSARRSCSRRWARSPRRRMYAARLMAPPRSCSARASGRCPCGSRAARAACAPCSPARGRPPASAACRRRR